LPTPWSPPERRERLLIITETAVVKNMKKSLYVALDDEEIIELMRILMDDDAEAALAFLKKHFKGKARELLEGG
jgi:hypothetical protein